MGAVDAEEVERLRADTPAVGAGLVHLNHAGASLCPEPVLQVVVDHLRLEAEIGGYEAADREAERIDAVGASVGRLIGAAADEVAVVDSATRAWHLALDALPLPAGATVLVSRPEYVANVLGLLRARDRRGVRLEQLPDTPDGSVDPAATADRLARGDVAAVALTWVPSQGGLVQPAAEVGAVCRAAGVPFLLDACQAVGQLAVDVAELGCDVLAATGRKFLRAPRGTGFLFVRQAFLDRLDPAPWDAHSTRWTGPDTYEPAPGAQRFETFERPVAAVLGLGAAAEYAAALGPARTEARVVALGEALRHRLAGVEGVTVHDQGTHRCGIVTFTVDGVAAADVTAHLRAHRVNTSVSPAESARVDLGGRDLDALVRASVHYLTVGAELDRCAELVADLAPTT
jgi:selenocysteine lyase/cysteine desulfurase